MSLCQCTRARSGSASSQALLREGWIPGEGGCSGGERFADVDLGWGGVGGRVWAGVWEAGAGLCLAFAVPVPVEGDASAGEFGQRGVLVGGGQGGGQACGRRAGAGGGDDRAAGGGEGDLARLYWLAGAASFRGWGGDRGGGAGDGPGEFDGGDPRGVFLGDQGWGGRAEDRSGGRSGAVDGGFGFFERGF